MQKSAYGGPKDSTEKPSSRDRRKLSVKKIYFFFIKVVCGCFANRFCDFFNKIVLQNTHEDEGFLVVKLKISEIKIASFQLFYLISFETPFGDG